MKKKMEVTKSEIAGIPCTIEEDPENPEPAFTVVTLHAIRGTHTPAKVLSAFHLAKDSYGAVHMEWSDPHEELLCGDEAADRIDGEQAGNHREGEGQGGGDS
jgi:hypothetical protein